MKTYTLQSNKLVCAPGVVAWAISGAQFPKDRALLINVIAKTWSIPEDVATQLVLKKVPYTITEDECVTFHIPTKRG